MVWDRKIYDRDRARKIYDEFKTRRLFIFSLLGNKCYLCGKDAKLGFHLHHIKYDDIESNYPRNSKSMSTRLKRLKEAECHSERFILLCPKHHSLITLINSGIIFKGINIKRLLGLIHAYNAKARDR